VAAIAKVLAEATKAAPTTKDNKIFPNIFFIEIFLKLKWK
jgi:hypothetical protein